MLNLKFSGECFVDLFFSTFPFVLCVVRHSVDYVIWLPFCPLFCLSFCELRHMITLLSFVLSLILWSTSYDYPFVLCVFSHSVKYVIWLPFSHLCCLSFCELRHMITLLSFVLSHSVKYLIWLPFCSLCCLSFCEVRHMITLLVSSYFSCNMFDEDCFFFQAHFYSIFK